MTDANRGPDMPRQTEHWLEPGKANVLVVYILYLAGFFVGITPIIGLVLAYMNRGRAEPWLETHYTWAIRTFWIGVLYSLISVAFMIVGIGFLLMLGVAVWVIVRVIIGLQALNRNEPIRNPYSWWI